MCIHTSTELLGAGQVDALDFFIPKSSRHHDISSPVKHRRSWSTWRGLSSAHAEDLAICELAFRGAVKAKVAAYVDGFLDYSAKQESTITVKVNLHELAIEIAEVYDGTTHQQFPLLPLSSLVQFIRLHDCFVRPVSKPGCEDPSKARIRVKMLHNSNKPVIVAYTPKLVFDDLVVQVQEGQKYYLKPRYCSVPISSKTNFEPQVTYTTTCDWLRYNEEHKHFAGTLPRNSGAAQNIEVEATIIYRFPDTNIVHEEIIRAVVKILPILSSVEPDHPALVKHVRFAAVGHEVKTPAVPQLRTRNSSSVLENCSNMDQDWRRNLETTELRRLGNINTILDECMDLDDDRRHAASSSTSDDAANDTWSPITDSDEDLFPSFSLAAPMHMEPDSKPADSQKSHKPDEADETLPEAENVRAGLANFFKSMGYGPTALEDDGIATQVGENMRKACEVKFAADEDPRDVREMKKGLMQMELEDMSKSMLGYRVDRWGSDETGVVSDLDEVSEASELETSLRESIGYCG